MAKSWEVLKKQHDKVRKAAESLTPPQPSDEYESLKGEVFKHMDKLDSYLNGQITGDGSVSLPEAEPGR